MELQRQYAKAAAAYNTAEKQIAMNEQAFCTASTATADLVKCEAALSQDRQVTIAFDNAIRALTFPAQHRGDVNKLLNDDGQLENALKQASTAPSLSAINALTAQIFSLLSTTSTDANRVRADIGLQPASPPASPSTAPA
jgi:hypothetical protein